MRKIDKSNAKKRFSITAKLELEVSIDVDAASLADAVEMAKGLKEADFVTIDGDFNDGSIEIIGAYRNL